ncbi:hypothetical protein ZYGR_0AD00540 [Zygosaccharomyces rouxii]|uniref:ZYRO0G07150p n=2 Tax=Zygosaccharomyces rouxii TaxID=4956 RepID=C5DZT8_ZYGRC|nr:uncharacterized protein ZYRO0G07150g [Zygosaccharomyces rouxii]GAV50871.1 hypothetical protein ZYGR_0AD00540 [Zygosaccharomyces rouxii]CAR29372.1 ZYRO0G07150p [Zygosaccharomyces rouxii]
MFRGLVFARSIAPVSLRTFQRPLVGLRPTTVSQRWYAQSWDGKQPNDQIEAHLKVQKLMDDIHKHPRVAEKLENVSKIMLDKGLANGDESKPPGPWQMVKILMDKDLKNAMAEFKQELQDSGIELGPDQLGPLMTVLGIEKKTK